MSEFNLDIKVSQGAIAPAQQQTITTTRTLITKTPVCTKFTCHCTTVGACTSGCSF